MSTCSLLDGTARIQPIVNRSVLMVHSQNPEWTGVCFLHVERLPFMTAAWVERQMFHSMG